MFLPRADIERLTARVRFSAQRRALDALGLRYIRAANGEPLVRIEALDGDRKPRGPRWDRIAA